jgi:NDP-sugar pyrophosphorylase family protein
MRRLHISAGGKNTRIKDYLESNFDGIPKHILPVPGKSTLIESIVDQATAFFDEIIIEANASNIAYIQPLFAAQDKVKVTVDSLCTGPLGPMVRAINDGSDQIFACAGDYFCDFSWEIFLNYHELLRNPISILTARSTEAPDGARFNVMNGTVSSWERVGYTSSLDLINIGCYIIDVTPRTVELLSRLPKHKEDDFFDLFIPNGMISAYDPCILGFNINTPKIYSAMCEHLHKKT